MVDVRARRALAALILAAGCSDIPEEVMSGPSPTTEGGSSTGPSGATDPDTGSGPTSGVDTGTGSGDGTATEGCTDELCNGMDDDCDGEVDEGCECIDGSSEDCYDGDPGLVGTGVCAMGTRNCVGGSWGACEGQTLPSDEECNGADDDCDGESDEGFGQQSCGEGICTVTVDACVDGVPQECTPGMPQDEICNGLDDDCDGDVDEIMCDCLDGEMQACYSGPMGTEGVGECVAGTQVCVDGSYGPCMGDQGPVAEICNNGLDEDCDGTPDGGCCSQAVNDGGYELGAPNPEWSESSTNFPTPLCSAGTCPIAGAHGGSWWAWFGGVDGYELGSLTQDLLIPAGGMATLSFWLEILDCAGMGADSLTFAIDGVPVASFNNSDPACGMVGYVQHMVDVSVFADGGVHTLSIVGEVFGQGPPATSITNFFVDDVQLVSCI